MATLNFYTVNDPETVFGTLTLDNGSITTTGCAANFINRYVRKGMAPAEIFDILAKDWSNGHFFTRPA